MIESQAKPMLKLLNKYSGTILKYAVAVVILSIPLYPKFPFLRIPGTYVSIRLEDFVLLAVNVIWLIHILPDIGKFFSNKVNRSIFLFLGIGLLSVLSGIFLTKTVVLHIGILHWVRRVEYLMCFFIGVSSVRNKQDLIFYIKCFLIVVFFVFVYGFGQKYFTWPVITTQNDEYAKGVALRFMPGGHLVSTFAGHYDLATFLALFLPMFVVFLTSRKNILSSFNFGVIPPKLVFLVASLMSLWLLVHTASRISIAAYFIGIVVALVLVRRFLYIPLVIAVSLIFISTSSNLMQRYIQLFDVYVKKVINVNQVSNYFLPVAYAQEEQEVEITPEPQSQPVVEDRSTSIRLNVEWPRAIRAFRKNPILGTGYSSITLATDNDYLRMIGETGLLGILSFVLIFFKIGLVLLNKVKSLFKYNISSLFILSIISAVPGVFLNGVFIDVFEASKFAIIFWLVLGFCLSTLKILENDKKI